MMEETVEETVENPVEDLEECKQPHIDCDARVLRTKYSSRSIGLTRLPGEFLNAVRGLEVKSVVESKA
jgi:hypothetical protein